MVIIDIERFSEVARFIRSAVETNAHLQVPKRLSARGWERNVDMTITHALGAYEGKENNRFFTQEEVGKIFPSARGPLTRQAVSSVVIRTVDNLWHNCPPDIQAQYPLDTLKQQIGQPYFLTSSEGLTRGIVEALDTGADYDDLRKKYSPKALSVPRQVLSLYGIDVPSKEKR